MDINSAQPPTSSPALSFDKRKIEIEERKLQIEHQKLKLERRKTNLTAYSIGVPALLGVGAILFNGYGARQNAQRAFELEAAKVLMQSEDPEEVSGKAETFSKMFPQYLSSGFGSNFNPELFQNYGPSVRQRKKDLFQRLAPRYRTTKEVARLYATPAFFPTKPALLHKWIRKRVGSFWVLVHIATRSVFGIPLWVKRLSRIVSSCNSTC